MKNACGSKKTPRTKACFGRTWKLELPWCPIHNMAQLNRASSQLITCMTGKLCSSWHLPHSSSIETLVERFANLCLLLPLVYTFFGTGNLKLTCCFHTVCTVNKVFKLQNILIEVIQNREKIQKIDQNFSAWQMMARAFLTSVFCILTDKACFFLNL